MSRTQETAPNAGSGGVQAAPPTGGDGPPGRASLRGPVLFGVIVLILFVGGLVGWGATAQLSSAAIAPGRLNVESNRKTVKHLEGGIVAQIFVDEGEAVDAGQPVLALDSTQARAKLALLETRRRTATARHARLRAEQMGLNEIAFPEEFRLAAPGSPLAALRRAEQDIFDSRRDARENRRAALIQQVRALNEAIEGLAGENRAARRQIELINEEIADMEYLYEKGFSRKPRLLELQREQARIQGRMSANHAEIGRLRQRIAETEIKIQEIGVVARAEVDEQIRETQSEIFDLQEQIRSAQDVLARTIIRAPSEGVIVNMQVHTIGGVIQPGEPLMDVVPGRDQFLIEARLDPKDIEQVAPGDQADVRFTALNQRDRPPARGVVRSISADVLIDEASGAPYYLTRIDLDPESLTDISLSDLRAGMQADVYILTGQRTPLAYLIDPFLGSFDKALREP